VTENEEREQTQPLIVRTYGPGLRCGERYAAPARFIDADAINIQWQRIEQNAKQRGWYEQRKERAA